MRNVAPIFEWDVAGQAEPIRAVARVPGIEPQPCAIMHYNRDGACICSSLELPDCFILSAIGSRVERICQVKWRMDAVIGVQFVNARTMGRVQPSLSASSPSNIVALFPRKNKKAT
jgi:hypothetical protein